MIVVIIKAKVGLNNYVPPSLNRFIRSETKTKINVVYTNPYPRPLTLHDQVFHACMMDSKDYDEYKKTINEIEIKVNHREIKEFEENLKRLKEKLEHVKYKFTHSSQDKHMLPKQFREELKSSFILCKNNEQIKEMLKKKLETIKEKFMYLIKNEEKNIDTFIEYRENKKSNCESFILSDGGFVGVSTHDKEKGKYYATSVLTIVFNMNKRGKILCHVYPDHKYICLNSKFRGVNKEINEESIEQVNKLFQLYRGKKKVKSFNTIFEKVGDKLTLLTMLILKCYQFNLDNNVIKKG